jgi:hypothetical protein
MKGSRYVVILLLTARALLATAEARGEEPAKSEAREHFKQGVALFDERRFGDALAEFQRSYSLYPAYSTLYNIGEVSVALGRPLESVEAFEKFLAEGGPSIPAGQRERVEAELKAQRGRVGDVHVTGLPSGAEVRVDGVVLATAPMSAPVRVPAGRHRVEAMLDGYHAERRDVDVAGQEHLKLVFELRPVAPAAGTIAPELVAPAPAEQVRVDPVAGGPERGASEGGAPAAGVPRASQPGGAAAAAQGSTGALQRIVGYCVGGLGLTAAGVGVAIAVAGQGKHDEALTQWASGDKATARQTEADSASEKTTGYITMGIGGAVLLTGAIVVLVAPSARPSQAGVSIRPWFGSSAAGANVGGVW